MSVADTARLRRSERSNGWWGMLIFLAAEATLFGTIVGSYFYLRLNTTRLAAARHPRAESLAPVAADRAAADATMPLRVR